MSFLVTSRPVTVARKKAVEIVKTAETVETSKVAGTKKDKEDSKYLEINLV